MIAYPLSLFVHFVSLLVACVAASIAFVAGLRLRDAGSVPEARTWLRLVHRVVPLFPLAVLGLVGSGAYMTHARWSWSLPWIDAALVGLALIVALGNGVEATRMRAVDRELDAAGMSPRARRLLRDPLLWSARVTTVTLFVAVVFVMTLKPDATGSALALLAAGAAGVLGGVPMWRTSDVDAASTTLDAASS